MTQFAKLALKNLEKAEAVRQGLEKMGLDRKSTRLNSSHGYISYAVFCLKKKNTKSTPAKTVTPTHEPHTAAPSIQSPAMPRTAEA